MEVNERLGRRRKLLRLTVAGVVGFVVGGLLTELSIIWLPDSAARSFLTTSVAASIHPFSIDVIGVALMMSLELSFNFLTFVGFGIVALVVRSWL